MFEKGSFIIYGRTGVCEVLDVTTMSAEDIKTGKKYYVLQPYNQRGDKIFTPTSNTKTIMRDIISKNEAESVMEDIQSIDFFDMTEDKAREEVYKNCVKSCECRELVKVIKTVYMRSQARVAKGKKVTAVDEKYMKQAEDALYSELAVVLKTTKDKIQNQIMNIIIGEKKVSV